MARADSKGGGRFQGWGGLQSGGGLRGGANFSLLKTNYSCQIPAFYASPLTRLWPWPSWRGWATSLWSFLFPIWPMYQIYGLPMRQWLDPDQFRQNHVFSLDQGREDYPLRPVSHSFSKIMLFFIVIWWMQVLLFIYFSSLRDRNEMKIVNVFYKKKSFQIDLYFFPSYN